MASKKIRNPTKVRLTSAVLEKMKPEQIIYAEFADFGAMGACGTARIFATDSRGSMTFYLTGDTYKNKEDAKCLYEAINYLFKLKEEKQLVHAYGGFGNSAFKNPEANFTRDEDKCGFIYEYKGEKYFIPASANGVYHRIVSEFAPRKVPIKKLEKYLKDYEPRGAEKGEEADFLDVYIEQSKRNDSGAGWLDFSPLDYYNAVRYIRHKKEQTFILNWVDEADCRRALQKYRLRYIVDKIGWNALNGIIDELVEKGQFNIFERVSIVAGEKVEKIYSEVDTVQADGVARIIDHTRSNTTAFYHELADKIFLHPRIISFTKEERAKIHSSLMECSLNPNGRGIGLYLANYILSEDKLSYVEILPVVARIIRDLPVNDFNHEHIDDLFWLCGGIIDSCWRYIPEDEAIQKQFRDFIYNLYWPRVGSLWPILHRNEFSFNENAANKIFDDAASFIASLNDIDERNPEIKNYLEENANDTAYYEGPLGRRAFSYCLKKLKPEEQFETILKEVNELDYHEWLSYPSTVVEAELLLKELFRTDEKAHFKNSRLSVLESLIINPNTKGVGEYILNYIVEHCDSLEKILETAGYDEERTISTLVDLFVAACMGVTENEELAPIGKWKEKLASKYGHKTRLERAEKFAKKRQKTVAFQRKELAKLMKKGLPH